EAARVVGAGGDAVAAADAPVVVHHHDAVGLHPGGLHRADVHARRGLAGEALRPDIEGAGGGAPGEEVVLGVAEVDLPLLVLVDADVLNSRFPILIILLHAAADAVHVAAALRDVEGVAVEHPRPRSSGEMSTRWPVRSSCRRSSRFTVFAFSSSVIRRKFPWKYSCQSSVAFSRASA